MRSRKLRGAALVVAVAAAGWLVTGSSAIGAAPRGSSTPAVPVAKPRAVTASAPGPHVLPFARQLPATQKAPTKTRPSEVVLEEGFDGCDHTYGNRHQCVPWTFPRRTQSGCDWLKAHGFGTVRVHGRDRHRLDTNQDGIACGPGDTRKR